MAPQVALPGLPQFLWPHRPRITPAHTSTGAPARSSTLLARMLMRQVVTQPCDTLTVCQALGHIMLSS